MLFLKKVILSLHYLNTALHYLRHYIIKVILSLHYLNTALHYLRHYIIVWKKTIFQTILKNIK